jgi:hypothetical protein
VIGHALIQVLPDGSFQLETKPDSHKSLDALLLSLEPDVELAASYFNTAVKKPPTSRPALPSKSASAGGMSSAALADHLASLFPEKSDDDIAAAIASSLGDQQLAADFLSGSSSPRGAAAAAATAATATASGATPPSAAPPSGPGPAATRIGRVAGPSTALLSNGAPTRSTGGALPPSRGGGAPPRGGGVAARAAVPPGATRGGGVGGVPVGRLPARPGVAGVPAGAAAIAAGPGSLRRTAAAAAAPAVDESTRSNDSVDLSDLDALADFDDDGKKGSTPPRNASGLTKSSGGNVTATPAGGGDFDLDSLEFDLEAIATSKPPPKVSPATPNKGAMTASLSPALPEKTAAVVAAAAAAATATTATTTTATTASDDASTSASSAGGASGAAAPSAYVPTALLDEDPMSNKPDYKKKAAEKVTEDLILVEEDGQVYVKAGTLERLVQRVTTDEYADINFMLQFLLTYRSFTTHDGLLAELIKRYDEACPAGADAKEWNDKLVKIRLRVVNLLRTWVTKHWVDFDGNPELQSKVEKFVETTVSASNASLASNLIKVMRSKQADEVKKKTVVFSSKAPKPLAPLDKPIKAEFNWMDYHATEIARQMTLIEYDIYTKITPFEFLENGWSRKDKEKRAPNILRMTKRFNMVSSWVQSQMCTRADFRERVHMLQRFIEVAERLRELNNLNGVSEIVSGLNSSPVFRLKQTWGALPQRARDVFAQLDAIMQPNGAYKAFRDYLHTCRPPCIPYLGVYLTDLTFIEDGCKDVVMQGDKGSEVKLVNFEKCRKTARAIQEISQYQDTPFNLTSIDYMRDALLEMGYDTVDNNYKKSLELEARGNDAAGGDVDLRASKAAPKKERFTERDRFVSHSPLATARLPDNLVYEAKSALSVMDATIEVLPAEAMAFRISGPTADERRTTKDYVLRAESVQDMAEWMQALLMAGAGGDASLSESLALSNVYDRGGDLKSGFLGMRAAGGAQALLKQSFTRSWFVLDKRQQLLWHGPLVVPYPDIDPFSAPPDDRCVFAPLLFAAGVTPTAEDFFSCNSCLIDEMQTRAADDKPLTQFLVCTACLVNCHVDHDLLLARRKTDSIKTPLVCSCRRCVRKLYKADKKAAVDGKGAPKGKAAAAAAAGSGGGAAPVATDRAPNAASDDNDDADERGRISKKPSFMNKGIGRLFQSSKKDKTDKGADKPAAAAAAAAATTTTTTTATTPSAAASATTLDKAVATPAESVSPLASPRPGQSGVLSPRATADSTAATAATTISTPISDGAFGGADGDAVTRSRSPRGLPAGVLEVARIVEAYVAEETNELSIEVDDEVNIFRKNEDTGWLLCELRTGPRAGARGWIPASFGVPIEK